MRENRLNILGVGVDPVRFDEALEQIEVMVGEGGSHHVVTINPEFIMRARQDKEFKRILNKADLATADGFGVRLAATYLNKKSTWLPIVREAEIFLQGLWIAWQAATNRRYFLEVPELVTGVDLVWALAKLAARKRYSLYLLDRRGGLAPNTAKRAAGEMKKVYQGLKIAGAATVNPHHEEIVRMVQAAKPDILLVAFGFPEQDLFIARNLEKLDVKVAIGVGGSFDYIAGNRPRPPQVLRGKFEWLWRLVTPSGVSWEDYQKRAKRIFTASVLFPLAVFQWKRQWGSGLGWIKVLALDFGGVMNRNGVSDVLRRAWRVVPFYLWPALALFYWRFIPELERGKMAEVAVWTKFMGLLGSKRDLATLRLQMIDGFAPNEEMYELVREVKKDNTVRLALLTNNVKEWMDIWERRYKLSRYFDPIIASCYVGLRKPNPRIFRRLIKELGVRPEEVVFVDDHHRNVTQARRLGIRAIRCGDVAACARALSELVAS